MSNPDRPGEVRVQRRLDRRGQILLAQGDFRTLFDSWYRHVRLWEGEPDGLSAVLMRQGLAGLVLHLVNRPRNETVAWTLNFRHPPTNLFLSGSSGDGGVTGRVFTQGVQVEETSRFYVQILKSQGEPYTSVLEITGFDMMRILEEYYRRSEQYPARFFEVTEERYLILLGLPGANREWLEDRTLETAQTAFDQGDPLDHRTFRFECGCNPEKILIAVRSIYHEDPEQLFRGEPQVEVFCPRCGRRWRVRREQF